MWKGNIDTFYKRRHTSRSNLCTPHTFQENRNCPSCSEVLGGNCFQKLQVTTDSTTRTLYASIPTISSALFGCYADPPKEWQNYCSVLSSSCSPKFHPVGVQKKDPGWRQITKCTQKCKVVICTLCIKHPFDNVVRLRTRIACHILYHWQHLAFPQHILFLADCQQARQQV